MADKAPTRRNRRFSVDDLFTDTRPQATGVRDLADAREIDLNRIEPDADQPRTSFDDDRLDELAASIRAEGVLQPIVVRYDATRDIYILLHGERRWRASHRAGITSIPALVRDVPEHRRLLQQLMENVVREDLNAVDRAAALRTLKQQMGDVGWDAVAEAVGIRRSRLFQLLGTEKLPDSAQEDIRTGKLSEKQSRALQGLHIAHQEALRALIVEEQISAQVASRIARALKASALEDVSHSHAEDDVKHLYGLIEPGDINAIVAQTAALLGAVQEGQASDLALLLGVPRFDEQRVAKEIGTLARSLTRTDAHQLEMSTTTRSGLEQLRSAIDALLRAN